MKFKNTFLKILLVISLVSVSVLPVYKTFADNTANPGETPDAQKARLQQELNALETEIAQKQALLDQQKKQSGSISGDISILQTEINKAKLNIKAKTLVIGQLSDQISEKNSKIHTLGDQIQKEKDSLAQLLRQTNELDGASTMSLLLTDKSISDFYRDLDSFGAIQASVRSSVLKIKDDQAITENEKKSLQKSQDAALDAKAALESSKKQVETSQAQATTLLQISKTKEKQYADILKDRQAKAASIRAALFALAGGGNAIPFGTALTYAYQVQKQTGISPAFLLAIMTQESNLGANVGKCYLSDLTSGAGSNISSGKTYPNVMKPSRDIPPFVTITKSLGMDPLKTVVSCPIAGAGGWGGAMGPAQFIASTWAIFDTRLKSILGTSTPNPWAPRDAFMASGLYLSDLGATSTYSSQIRAACKYYGTGGSNCSYGNQVMAKAANIQQNMIDPLQGL